MTAKKIALLVSFASVALFLGATSAQALTATSSLPGINKEVREERADFRENVVKPTLQDIKEQREAMKGASSTTRTEIRGDIKTQREELKEKRQSFREDMRKKLAEGLRARLLKSLSRIDVALDRLENINRRVETRITKLESAGINPITSKELLIIAKSKNLVARTAVSDARSALSAATISTSTDTGALKDILKTAETSAKEAHKATTEAVSSLQGLSDKASTERGTSTPRQ